MEIGCGELAEQIRGEMCRIELFIESKRQTGVLFGEFGKWE